MKPERKTQYEVRNTQYSVRSTEYALRSTQHAPRTTSILSGAILALASLLGLAAFLYPFFMTALPQTGAMAHANDAPLLTVLLLGLCLIVVFTSLTAQQLTNKLVAVLGVLTAMNAVLRLLPGPGGFNAIFVLPILAGYAYGPVFGFLLGALSLLVSALIGGGVGPWLPYQMYATGWMGLLSGMLPGFPARRHREPVLLAVWGVLLGFLFGAIMNIWFWPFLAGGAVGPGLREGMQATWQPGMAITQTLQAYAVFYVATSLWWDVARAVGNGVLILLFGRAILRVLRRFQRRFRFTTLRVLGDPLLDQRPGFGAGDGEPDPLNGRLIPTKIVPDHQGDDPDHLAVGVEQGAAGIAAVDRRVGLDQA